MGAHFEALDDGVLLVPLDPRYTQVGFNLVPVQVCASLWVKKQNKEIHPKDQDRHVSVHDDALHV